MRDKKSNSNTNNTIFNYNSIFKYTKVTTDEQLFCDPCEDRPPDEVIPPEYPLINLIAHKLIVLTFYLLFIITFPISAFFCVKRIHSLQRCIVYRLGIRLPLKGPGIIIKFPIIDCIEVIDLSDYEFDLIDKSQQLMTSDGSILEFSSSALCLNVMNAIRSSTQLKDAKFNVKQFCRLSFTNMIGSTHVEDWENKTHSLSREFEQNCNIYLNNWGYNCKFNQIPKFIVTNRANPINPIVSKLKSMFGGGEAEEPNGLMAGIMKMQSNTGAVTGTEALNDSEIVESLQAMSEKYKDHVFHDINIAIQVLRINSNTYFTLSHSNGEVNKLEAKPHKVHINISADTIEELTQFCRNKDMKSVRITTNLF